MKAKIKETISREDSIKKLEEKVDKVFRNRPYTDESWKVIREGVIDTLGNREETIKWIGTAKDSEIEISLKSWLENMRKIGVKSFDPINSR